MSKPGDRSSGAATLPLHLRSDPACSGPDLLTITPETAGWTYAGLRVVQVDAGASLLLETGSVEMAVLPLAGGCTVECERFKFELRGRPDVFSQISDFAYIPMDAETRLTSPSGGRFALASAIARRRLEPAYGPAEGVPVEVRGTGASTRQVNNFLAPGSFPADTLVAVEVLTPSGNWSSYPPHKHDECRAGEAILEEIYYFETGRSATVHGGHPHEVGKGFALQRLYTDDGEIDLTVEVRHGDAVLVPRGYHGPSVAAPGYDLYYLNVLAGPGEERTMAFRDDPDHHWVRDAWAADPPDPRVPMTSLQAGRR